MSFDPSKHAQYNTCKKIVQLTRIIYRLHSQNVQHEDRLRNVKAQYEHQIHELTQKTDQLSRAQKEDLDRRKREYQEAVMREYQQKFTKVRSEYQQKQTHFLEAIQTAESQVEALKTEVEHLKVQCAAMTKRFDSGTKRITAAHRKEISGLSAKHAAKADSTSQIADLSRTIAEQKQTISDQECIIVDHRQTITNRDRTISDQTAQIASLKRAQTKLQRDLRASREETADLLKKFDTQTADFERARNEGRLKLANCEESLAAKDRYIGEQEMMHSAAADALQKSVAELTAERNSILKDVQDAQNLGIRLRTEIGEMEQRQKLVAAKFEDERNALLERIRRLEFELSQQRNLENKPKTASVPNFGILERRFRCDRNRPAWNLPPLEEEEPRPNGRFSARRKKRIRIDP
jgi:chromosome segregation ATPase